MYDEVSQTRYRRYEVTEGFCMADRVTQEPYVTLTRDSHAYHVGVTFTACEYTAMPPDAHALRDRKERARLFDTFYAAMAALEWQENHTHGASHHNARFSEEDVRRMRTMATDGLSISAISKVFAASSHTIRRIVRGKQWKHLLEE
jgi:hypothetical protein